MRLRIWLWGVIEELLSETFEVNLITRPRRFGKTLTMSMLAEFLDIRKDSKGLFEGLEISKNQDLCGKWMNQWPVIFLTLKDVEGKKFEKAYGLLEKAVSKLCIEHAYLAQSDKVDLTDREVFLELKSRTISYFNYKEDYYQGFVSGLFSGAGYEVKSDLEQGKGRRSREKSA